MREGRGAYGGKGLWLGVGHVFEPLYASRDARRDGQPCRTRRPPRYPTPSEWTRRRIAMPYPLADAVCFSQRSAGQASLAEGIPMSAYELAQLNIGIIKGP